MNKATLTHPPSIREVYPYLCVRGAAAAIDFYTRVFGAHELMRLTYPDGRIAHAELKLGPGTLMLVDELPEYGIQSPLAFGGTGTTIHLHVDDVDTLTTRALDAGATVLRAPTDEGHGERQARLRDPFGHEWLLGHQIEAVSPEEIQRRFPAEFQPER
jgi:PhnB protein